MCTTNLPDRIFKVTTVCCRCKRRISTICDDLEAVEEAGRVQYGGTCRSEYCGHIQGICCRELLLELFYECWAFGRDAETHGMCPPYRCKKPIDTSFVRYCDRPYDSCYEELKACWTGRAKCYQDEPPEWWQGRRDLDSGEIYYAVEKGWYTNNEVNTYEMNIRYKEGQDLRRKFEDEIEDLKRKVENLEERLQGANGEGAPKREV